MSQLHQAHCLRQCGRHCRDKGDQQQAADDGHIVHKHIPVSYTHLDVYKRQVLDCGCGGGANIKTLLKLCPKGKVQGIDYSAVSVERCV